MAVSFGTQGPRVVSLLPSATEVLCAIGAGHLLVGRSHECDYPRRAGDRLIRDIPVVTSQKICAVTPAEIDAQVRAALASTEGADAQSLYHVHVEVLASLKPDVILTQDLCSVCSVHLPTVQRIAASLNPVPKIISLNPSTVEDILDDHIKVGLAIDAEESALHAVVALRDRLFSAGEFVNPFDEGPSVAFLEWTDPLFCGGHWNVQLIERAGGRHPLNPTAPIAPESGAAAGPQHGERRAGPSRIISIDELIASQPQRIVIAPCGFNYVAAHAAALSLRSVAWWNQLPASKLDRSGSHIAVVDGNQYFNRPGPRIVDAYEWLVSWLSGGPQRALLQG